MRKARLIDIELGTLIDELALPRDRDGVAQALKTFTRACGFEQFAYVCTGGRELTGISNYQQQWQVQYREHNLTSIDPIVRLARQHMQPFSWSGDDTGFQGREHRSFFDAAERFGIRSGLTIPIPASYGRFAMLTLVSATASAAAMVAIANPVRAVTATALVHACMARLADGQHHAGKPVLTGRQLACLAWASFGKTMLETALLLGISDNTVRFHLEVAKARLGASNMAHAIRIAVERGLI